MKNVNSLIVILFFFLSVESMAQCESKVEVKKIVDATMGQKNGEIRLSVETRGSFTCELLAYKNREKVKVDERKGTGNEEIFFDALSPDFFYRVSTNFHAESDPFCKDLVIEKLILKSDKD